MNILRDWPILLFLLTGVTASIASKKLTAAAAITGGVLGWLVYAGGGYTGLGILVLFFILGTAATSWKKKEKLSIRANAGHQSTRTIGQVVANAGVAALAALLALLLPSQKQLFQLMLAGSLSAAMADTLSSELGMVYGRHFYNILSWSPDEKGEDGVVSIEGLLIGIGGSAIIALVYAHSFLIIILAGTIGNLADSLLGALFERRKLLSNNAVNFLNTLIGALAAGLFTQITLFH
jgi:uncharacterized protein (TIGR00297 family)